MGITNTLKLRRLNAILYVRFAFKLAYAVVLRYADWMRFFLWTVSYLGRVTVWKYIHKWSLFTIEDLTLYFV